MHRRAPAGFPWLGLLKIPGAPISKEPIAQSGSYRGMLLPIFVGINRMAAARLTTERFSLSASNVTPGDANHQEEQNKGTQPGALSTETSIRRPHGSSSPVVNFVNEFGFVLPKLQITRTAGD
jgi:hypothetical protein